MHEDAIRLIKIFEGGYSDHPLDKGGATHYGITQAVYDRYRLSEGLPLLTVEAIGKLEVDDIYLRHYWEPSKAALLPEDVRAMHFDTAVNCGVRRAAITLQRACGAKPDGWIGPKTLAAVEETEDLLDEYVNERMRFYTRIVANRPEQIVFLEGWQRRVRYCQWHCEGTKTLEEIESEW